VAQIARSIRFFRKAEEAILAAIELYNKPDFRYREEAFAVLSLNAWELLLKAKLLAESGNHARALFLYEKRQTKKGIPSTKFYLRRNRTGNIYTIGLGQVIAELENKKGVKLALSIKANLDGELSDGVIRPFNATREGRRGPTSEIPVCSESSADFGRQRGFLSWFYWDDPPGDVELVRIPSAPSVECSAGSGISGSPVARGPG